MSAPTPASSRPGAWTAHDAAALYGIHDWGAGYFEVSEQGEVRVNVRIGEKDVRVALIDIVAGMKDRGLGMPAILRIENLLDHRVEELNNAFTRAIEQTGYRNHYRGVFPIKVNQQCHVIEEIAAFGNRYHHGLEAGSKAELLIALSQLKDHDSLLVCNGYKDAEFIELGLHARQLGVPCFFVLEAPAELPIIIERSRAMGVDPLLGVRIKLSVKVEGHWEEDSGDRSIFGMSTAALLSVVGQLKEAGMLHCLKLLHCHLGSQIPNIRNIRNGTLEACRFYAGLIAEGAPLGYLNMGGGLAVDYDGSRTNTTHSMNYRLDEYCVDIIETVRDSLDPLGIPHPVIITESGRATVAYSSLLLFDILDVRRHEPKALPEAAPPGSHEHIENLFAVLEAVETRNLQECYNDSIYYRDEVRELFRHGQISLRERALADNVHLAVLERIVGLLPQAHRVPPELEQLPERLADVYYGNFSLFQSLPDIWAIDQIFPIMPIHRLDEEPTREAILADLTCDSDGRVDRFTGPQGTRATLPLHPLRPGEDYYLGVFLVGAYQETLGDLHNLFGDTNVVSAHIDADGRFTFVHEFHGDSIADVLSYVEYEPKMLLERFRRIAESAVRCGDITVAQRTQMIEAFSESLRGYTYFEH